MQIRTRPGVPLVALSLATLALWLLSRPYAGIVEDARLYVGRALATLSPGTIGRDIMFVHDGQFGFTLFSAVTVPLVRVLGPETASMLLALAGLVSFVGATAFLAAALGRGGVFWAMMMFPALVPASYGGFDTLTFAQPLATPRPFACAAVLVALRLCLDGRPLRASVALLAGALFHPIMVLPGVALVALTAAVDLRGRPRILAAGLAAILAAGLAVLVAAWLDLPVAGRLFSRVDPEWRAVLESRNTYLFATQWELLDWSRLVVHAASLALASIFLAGRPRIVLLATAAIGPAGVIASVLFGDLLGSLLVMQVQLWRFTWLTSLLSIMALPLCWHPLWSRGRLGRSALALILTAWVVAPVFAVSGLIAVMGLGAGILARRTGGDAASRLLPTAAWLLLVFGAGGMAVINAFVVMSEIAGLPAPLRTGPPPREILFALYLPLCAVILAALQDHRIGSIGRRLAPLAIAASLVVLPAWDQRSPWQALVDATSPDPALAALVGTADDVLWLDEGRLGKAVGFAAWRLAGRPNWASGMQGASIVFSRPLAMHWRDRVDRLLDSGLAEPSAMMKWENTVGHAPVLDPTAVARFCRRADAPSAIIVPEEKATYVISEDEGRVAGVWVSSATAFARPRGPGTAAGERWIGTDRFVVLRCRGLTSGRS